jgi:hypothetical protein
VNREYPKLWYSLQYVIEYDVDGHDRQPPEEPLRELTDAEREILRSHERLIISLAKEYSRGKSFNYVRFVDLMAVGLQEMVKRIPKWEPARKITIGAYLKPFIRGAMKERIRKQVPTSSMTHNVLPLLVKENIERWRDGHGLEHLDGIAAHKRRLLAEKKAGKRRARTRAKAEPKPKPDIPVAHGNTAGQFTAQQYQGLSQHASAEAVQSNRDGATDRLLVATMRARG